VSARDILHRSNNPTLRPIGRHRHNMVTRAVSRSGRSVAVARMPRPCRRSKTSPGTGCATRADDAPSKDEKVAGRHASARAVASTAGFRFRSIRHTLRPGGGRSTCIVRIKKAQGGARRRRTSDREVVCSVPRRSATDAESPVYHEQSRLVCVRHCIFLTTASIAFCWSFRSSFAIVVHETAVDPQVT